MQSRIGIADDRQLSVHGSTDNVYAEQLQCGGIDAGQIHVACGLQGVVEFLGEFRQFQVEQRNHQVCSWFSPGA